MRRVSCSGAVGILLAFLGCGSQVIPSVVIEGTTATIAIPIEFDVGYGRRLSKTGTDPEVSSPPYATTWPDNQYEDLQRGELVFTLFDGTTKIGVVPVRYITRVAQDPGSNRANFGSQLHENHFQPIAFLEIPVDLVPDISTANPDGKKDFTIEVHRWRREPPSLNFIEVEQSFFQDRATPPNGPNWFGWGSNDGGANSLTQRIPITIVDDPDPDESEVDHYTPFEAWGPYYAGGGTQAVRTGIWPENDLDYAIPMPEVRIQVQDSVSNPPPAWELQVSFPKGRMSISAVRLVRGNPSGGYVGWSADPSPTNFTCSTEPTGIVKLYVVDPEALTRGVSIAFVLANQGAAACQKRIQAGSQPDQVQIISGSYKSYNASGALLSGANPFDIVTTATSDLY